jgi:hypothetical protein
VCINGALIVPNECVMHNDAIDDLHTNEALHAIVSKRVLTTPSTGCHVERSLLIQKGSHHTRYTSLAVSAV